MKKLRRLSSVQSQSQPTGAMSTTQTETLPAFLEQHELQPHSKTTTRTPSHHQSRSSFESNQFNGNGNTFSDVDNIIIAQPRRPSNLRTFLTIFTPSFVGFIGSFTNGIITVGLPIIARDIDLERSLYLWPSSVYSLTSGAALLIAGSLADIVGAKPVELAGITLLGVFMLACGFAQTGSQLVAFRALQGIALAMHLPASVSIITGAVPSGRARNFGFACLGFSQPLGFAVGLVLSGVMIEHLGWRSGFYLAGACALATAIGGIWSLPKLKESTHDSLLGLAKKVCKDIDWIGGFISSGGLTILAYVLA